jgi:hypothetical protein
MRAFALALCMLATCAGCSVGFRFDAGRPAVHPPCPAAGEPAAVPAPPPATLVPPC